MKAQVLKITPEIAKNYLRYNTSNRDVSKAKLAEYVNAMRRGEWMENGESIIIDYNGVIKDGQHRLLAIEKSGISMTSIVVTDVNPNVMHTIDIGKSRSLADILKIHNYKRATELASLARRVYGYNKGVYSGSGTFKVYFTNSIGLDFIFNNDDMLYRVLKGATSIDSKQRHRLLSRGDIAFYLYVISQGDYNENHLTFLKHVTGSMITEGSAATWLSIKLYNYNKNKHKLQSRWLLAMIIKSWNLFNDGNPAIRNLSFNMERELPEVQKTLSINV